VGALARPIGGWVSDKLGGARVTFWNFLVMIGAMIIIGAGALIMAINAPHH
jgi:nitrate/nitrite transporter NarK